MSADRDGAVSGFSTLLYTYHNVPNVLCMCCVVHVYSLCRIMCVCVCVVVHYVYMHVLCNVLEQEGMGFSRVLCCIMYLGHEYMGLYRLILI